MDAVTRRMTANGYVWAQGQLSLGIKTTQEVADWAHRNPFIGFADGVQAAIDDFEQDQRDLEEQEIADAAEALASSAEGN